MQRYDHDMTRMRPPKTRSLTFMQPPEAPPEVKEWAQNTVVGVLFGIVYGGGRQWLADRSAGAHQCVAYVLQ